ncbi:Predicted branched-chain amino acid permease (azaleucine resistance) [Lachnospiraceae bacterium]|nr:Predicted branched-chain amino acid permease (azaleucine resistance) [Lachnospiraceae bacterium]
MLKEYKRGLLAGIPIALGYLSVSFTFGILAIKYGLTWWEAALISLTNLTSAGQFAGVQLMGTPGLWFDMILAQITINIRYSFMSIALSQKLDKRFKGIWRWILGFSVTDEIFAVGISEDRISRSFWAGLSTLPVIGWIVGTTLGAIMGNVLPKSILSALGLALYGMFVAIVVPVMKKEKPVVWAVLLASLFSIGFTYLPVLKNLSAGLAISVCAILSAGIMAVIKPVDEEGGAL